MGNTEAGIVVKRKGRTLDEVERFFRGVFIRGECERVEIRQRTPQGSTRIRDWVIPDLDTQERTPEWLATQLVDVAEEDARNLKGICDYGVLVYRKDEQEHSARHLIRLQGGSNGLDGEEGVVLGETEPPNAVGLVAGAQRHVEGFARITIGALSQVMMYQGSTIRAQAEMIDKMAEREERVMMLREKMLSEEHERKLELMRETKASERKDRVLDKVELLAPVFLGKYAPKEAKGIVATDTMRQVMKSLRPEQLEELTKLLDQEQAIAVMSVYNHFLAEEEAKEKKAAEAEKAAAE